MNTLATLIQKVILKICYSSLVGVFFLNKIYFPLIARKMISYNRDQISWFVREDSLILRVAIFKRLRFYHEGLKRRLLSLAEAYGIDQISFKQNDVVVDCGANIGEIGVLFKTLNQQVRYIAVEPDDKVNSICFLNTKEFAGPPLNIVLSNSDTEVDFYISSDLADSSAIQPLNFSSKVRKTAKKLDSLIDQLGLDKIKLFKLEAEGFEPEVLQGSLRGLQIIEYIAIDCGPERYGKDTIVECFNFLYSNRFRLVFSNFVRGAFLFRNENPKFS